MMTVYYDIYRGLAFCSVECVFACTDPNASAVQVACYDVREARPSYDTYCSGCGRYVASALTAASGLYACNCLRFVDNFDVRVVATTGDSLYCEHGYRICWNESYTEPYWFAWFAHNESARREEEEREERERAEQEALAAVRRERIDASRHDAYACCGCDICVGCYVECLCASCREHRDSVAESYVDNGDTYEPDDTVIVLHTLDEALGVMCQWLQAQADLSVTMPRDIMVSRARTIMGHGGR